MSAVTPPFGFNVIGYVTGNLGLGIVARAVIRMLVRQGYPVRALDLDPGFDRKNADTSCAQYVVDDPSRLPYAVNLFVGSPNSITGMLIRVKDAGILFGRLNAAYAFWELPVVPEMMRLALSFFDVVIAGSHFIEQTFARYLGPTRIISGPHPTDPPEGIREDRARFGIPPGAFTVGFAFDPLSDPSRKNPYGGVAAFQRAFASHDDVCLVLRANLPRSIPPDRPDLAEAARRLEHLPKRDPRILLITEPLAYQEILGLYASLDAYLSLHRAEGLGMGMLEAMSLGKPVIATGYSGNMSFMNHTNACIVEHTLVPVTATVPVYTRVVQGLSPFWAEPSMDDAVRWLRDLKESRLLCDQIGAAARESALAYMHEAAQARCAREIEAIFAHTRESLSTAATTAARHRALTRVTDARAEAGRSMPEVALIRAKRAFGRHIGQRLARLTASPR